jgi:hypothetical protein
MWSTLNAGSNWLTALLLAPVKGLSWPWQMLVLALPVTALALLVFRFASSQAGIRRAKRLIQAYLLEMRLFRDDLRVVARAQGRVFLLSLRYLLLALPPLAVMLLPMVLVLAQVEARFAHRPLVSGETAMLVVGFDALRADAAVELELPPGLRAETGALRITSRREVRWLLRAVSAGSHIATVHAGGKSIRIPILVDTTSATVAPLMFRSDDPQILWAPQAPALAAGQPFRGVEVVYPRAGAAVGGLSNACWGLFGLTMILGFVLRGRVGVTF